MDEVVSLVLHFVCVLALGIFVFSVNLKIESTPWAKKTTWGLIWGSIFMMIWTLVLLFDEVGKVLNA